jgi:signal transduction histidine kinase
MGVEQGLSGAAAEASDLVSLLTQMGGALFRMKPGSWDITFLHESWLSLQPGHPFSGSTFWEEALAPEERARVLELFTAVAYDGAPRTIELKLLLRTGRTAWVRTHVIKERSGTSPVPGDLLGTFQDLTASHQNELAWRELQSWLASLGEALPFEFWICDRTGRFVLQNRASLLRHGNVMGRRGNEADVPEELRRSWMSAFEQALSGGIFREELETKAGEKTRSWVRMVTPVRDGEVIRGALGVDMDVTALKNVELQLRQSLDELHQTQSELVRGSQLAALGEMAAVVAHEVRNPLGAMENALALLRRSPSIRPEERELLRVIGEEAARIEWLVANLLSFVRPRMPKLEPHLLGPVLDEALSRALQGRQEKRVRVERRLDEGLPPVPVDPNLLRLALTNVIDNAIQAMPNDGELGLSVGREQGMDGEWARIAIQDNGTGILPEHKTRLFEPFFSTRATGSGLGLLIVKRVVQEHRGTVELTSEHQGGTTCLIRLPLAEQPR